MWKNSKPSEYLSFRVFIFGITSQSMFPNGVIYDGVLDNKPLYFRGESGANDSMVSTEVLSPPTNMQTHRLTRRLDSAPRSSSRNPHAIDSLDGDFARVPRVSPSASSFIPGPRQQQGGGSGCARLLRPRPRNSDPLSEGLGPREKLPLAALVVRQRVHHSANSSPDCDRWKPDCHGMCVLRSRQRSLPILFLPPSFQKVESNRVWGTVAPQSTFRGHGSHGLHV